MDQNIIQLPPGISHQYLLNGNDGYLLIDTDIPNNYAHLLDSLDQVRVRLESILMVVITHADLDHYGCLNQLKQQSPALVGAASQKEADAMRLGVGSRDFARGVFTSANPLHTQIDRILTAGEKLPYLGGLEILSTPGHTPDHISLWSESTRTLFCGDSIKMTDGVPSPSSGIHNWDVELSLQSFEKQMALQPDRIFAGHGTWQRE